MASSATYVFNPRVAEFIDEAFERCDVDPATLTERHMESARRSLNFLLSYWATCGVNEYMIESTTHTTTTAEKNFSLPDGALDVLHATLKRNDVETEMLPITRETYMGLHDKDIQGRPTQYWVDKSDMTLYYWQAAENDTDVITYQLFRRNEDAGSPRNTLDIPYSFFEALAAGLAWKLSEKFARQETDRLEIRAERALKFARIENRERADTRILVSLKRNARR